MGPAAESFMSASTSVNIVNLPKLKDVGSKCVANKERVLNTLTSKGLRHRITGSAQKPADLLSKVDEWYKPDGKIPLSEDKIEEYEKRSTTTRRSKQLLDIPVDQERTHLFTLWIKLTSINEGKGQMVQVATLTKLQTLLWPAVRSIRKHISKLQELKEELDGMNTSLRDPQYVAYIAASLSATYRPLLTTLRTATSRVKTSLTSESPI
ncbi:hypothetical protein Hypma_009966 [Hypsizygus marmoreus]|uniref:Uncharacterized protein n=1 Tax=Hypsizygus marmoreus TaxID=39966 RepID=A0A369JKG1_HYPMA|nr:hypothetical protein Hypma_009966 [Hypsizygus marmoreus]